MQESLRDFDIAAVAEKAATGDRQAIAELFERKAESIYFTAFGILGDRTDAQDAAQEAVLRICQSIGSLKDPKAVEAWVLKIVRNVCYAMLNKAKPVRDAMDIEDMTLCLAEDDGDVVPERYAEDRERREQLFKIVMGLSTGQRETIFMYYYDDMSVKEIAGVTATNVNTVTANLTKARKMIRKRLMEDKQQYEGIAPSIMAAPASASALGRVLKESSTAMFTPEIKTALCERWTSALWGGHAGTSVSAASAEAASGPAVNIGVAVMVSLVAFTGILYLNIRHDIGAYADQATTSVIRSYGDVDGEIVFSGGDCDCGHLNPDAASLTERTAAVVHAAWDIKDEQTGQTLYTGGGKTVPSGLSGFAAGKGLYLLTFYVTDAEGNEYSVERVFELR